MKVIADLVEKRMPAEVRDIGGSFLKSILDRSRFGPFLLRHLGTIAKSVGVATLLGIVYLFVADPVYTAQSQILIDPGLPNVLRDQSIEPAMAMDSQQVETEIAVLRSEQVANAVVDRMKLGDDPAYRTSSIYDLVPSGLVPDTTKRDIEQEKALRTLAKFEKNLTVRRIGVSYGIDIFYSSNDPATAAEVANAVADEYIKFQIRTRADAAKIGSEWLEKRLADLRIEMNAAARRMQEKRAGQDYSFNRAYDRMPPRGPAGQPPPEKEEQQPPNEPRMSLEDLESTANTYRKIYENYLQSYMAAVQRQSFPIANARVITKASPPLSQSRSRGLTIVMAMMLGALAGIAIGYARDHMRATVA